jgi:cell division protein FtsB
MNPTQLQAVLQDLYARVKKLEQEIALLRKEQAQ